jgi:D-inositol-3-phosphate glycosyltransferase
MRVLMISEHASPLGVLGGIDSGGQNVYVAKLSQQLAAQGIEVDIVTRREDEEVSSTICMSPHVRLIHVPAGPARPIRKEELLPFMSEFADYCGALCRTRRYDLIHANFFMSGLVGLILKERFGLPLVVTFHALGKVRRMHQGDVDDFPSQRLDIEGTLVRAADGIIAECPQDREDLVKLYGADRRTIWVIPCGYDPLELEPLPKQISRAHLNIPAAPFVVLLLGRLVPRKGIDNAIKGFALFVREQTANAYLLVVGGDHDAPDPAQSPELARLMMCAERAEVQERVVFVGRKPRDQLKYYYSAADVFVSTPWYEPFGITPVEAMACATPVIGAHVGGIKSTVIDGETGLLVAPKDPPSLARALGILHTDPALRRFMGERGRMRAAARYTWAVVASAVTDLYGDVSDNRIATRWSARYPFLPPGAMIRTPGIADRREVQ